jgi:hypothetical protein
MQIPFALYNRTEGSIETWEYVILISDIKNVDQFHQFERKGPAERGEHMGEMK